MSRLEQLRKLVTLSPEDPLAHYGVGLELISLQRWDEAAIAFAAAITADGAYSAAYYHKARAEIAADRGDSARETLERGITIAKANGDWKTENEMRQLLDGIA